jgi:transcriptional regulator with XRE-family HTH domain
MSGRTWRDKEGHRERAKLIGRRVLFLRKESRLSQQALADRLGCPRIWISKIEREESLPNLPGLVKLAAGLQVSMAELLITPTELQTMELLADPFLAEIHAEGKGMAEKWRNLIVGQAKRMAGL